MLRSVLQPPRLRIGGGKEGEERHATWLELFYDLVFVVAVAELAHALSDHTNWEGFLSYVALFVPVWWSWIGAMFYATRFDTDDLVHRLLTVLQMFAVAALAVNVHGGLGETSTGFALSYVVVRAILIAQYLRARHAVPEARPLINWYLVGFATSVVLWTISIALPSPWRFVLWGVALLFDFGAPLTAGKLHVKIPPHTSHVPERMGLFTIIVLGEAVAAVVRAVADQEWSVPSALTALVGLSLAFSLWWSYFDNTNSEAFHLVVAKGRVRRYQFWLYTHLPLAIGLAAIGIGVEHAAKGAQEAALSDPDRWLLCGSAAICLLALGVIHLTSSNDEDKVDSRAHAIYHATAAALVLALAAFGSGLSPLLVVSTVAIACVALVLFDLRDALLGHR